MKRTIIGCFLVVAGGPFAATVLAHHSAAVLYRMDQQITIKGVVKRFDSSDFANTRSKAVRVTTRFTGRIGSGKQMEVVRATIGGKPLLMIDATFVKQRYRQTPGREK